MRVTEQMIQDSALQNLQMQMERLSQVNAQIASGKRLSRPGEDPLTSGEILNLRSNLNELEAYSRTLDVSRSWVAISDSALRELSDLVVRARTIAQRGSSASETAVRFPELADEVEGILQHAVTVANSRHGDDYIFAGFQTNTAPFALEDTTVTYRGATDPDVDLNEAIEREVEPGHRLQINVRGGALLPALTELADLAASLRAGDGDAIAQHLESLDEVLGQVSSQIAIMGTTANRLETVQARLGNVQLEMQGTLSQLESTDMAEAAVELNSREKAYQATLAAVARGTRPSLMDFLR